MAKAAKASTKNNNTDLDKYTAGSFRPVIDKCQGCERIVEADAQQFCRAYISPEAKWRLGLCNFATHVKPEITAIKAKINPLKASKRLAAKKKKK